MIIKAIVLDIFHRHLQMKPFTPYLVDSRLKVTS